jgi:hypothetical protein
MVRKQFLKSHVNPAQIPRKSRAKVVLALRSRRNIIYLCPRDLRGIGLWMPERSREVYFLLFYYLFSIVSCDV